MSGLVDIQQLEEARTRFTDLGAAITDMSRANTESFDSLLDSLREGFKATIDEISGDPRLLEGAKAIGASEEYISSIAGKFSGLSAEFDSVFEGMRGAITGAEQGFESLSKRAEAAVTEATAPSEGDDGEGVGGGLGGGTAQGGVVSKGSKGKKKKRGPIGRYLTSEVRTVKGRIGGMMSKLKIPKPAAIVAGFIGIMAYGYMDRDRVRAQSGEMKNILIAAYDDGVKGALAKGTSRLSAIQETFQRFLGIQREEIQATAQAFVDGGFSVSQMMSPMKSVFKDVESNAVTVTLALDKMFELPGGESAKRMVGMMADYGKTADEAKDSLLRMYMVGRDSGVGAMQFVKNVEDASSELARMGYNIDNVVDIYVHVTDAFSKMGVPKQFAGKQAAVGLQQFAGGVAKMGDNWKVALGERLGYGKGLEARQKMMDAFLRVLDGEDTNEVVHIVTTIYDMAMKATGEDEDAARYFMEASMGLGFEGARLIATIGKHAREGNMVQAAKAAKDNITILKNSFHTEAEKRSKFELMMNKWLKGLANFGQGLMGYVITALAYLIAYLKAMPQFIVNAITFNTKAQSELAQDIENLLGNQGKNKAKMGRGLDQMIASAKGMASDIMGPSLQALKKAWDYDPYGSSSLSKSPKGGGTPVLGGINIPAADLEKGSPFTQDIVPPRPVPGASSSKGSKGTKAGSVQDWGDKWVGGGLHLQVQSVDAEGSINILISGNCPRCGFDFTNISGYGGAPGTFSSMQLSKEGSFTSEDVEALARMIQSESGRYRDDRRKEQLGIAWTALNRVGGLKKGGGGKLAKAITAEKGWGASDAGNKKYGKAGRRNFASGARPDPETIDFARSILRGDKGTGDWTKGATRFIHRPTGSGHESGSGWKKGRGLVVPIAGGMWDKETGKRVEGEAVFQ
jgi:hypothetical protein